MTDEAQTARDFQTTLARYVSWSKKDQGPLIESRARRFRFALFRAFRAIAKTPAQLQSEISGLGYAIKRRDKSDADQTALRSAFGIRGALNYEDRTVSTEEEIRLRTKSLRFLSVSFIFSAWRGSGEGQQKRFSARSRHQARIGEAIVSTRKGTENPFVSLTSFLEGVVAQNSRRRIVAAAMQSETRDMLAYLERKHRERLVASFRHTFNGGVAA